MAVLLLTSCPGNGGAGGSFDVGSGETYAAPTSSGTSRSSSSSGGISFEDIMNFSNSGDTDALVRLLADGSGESGEAGTDVVALSVSSIGLPSGGTVTLSITGDGGGYEETATASDDGMVYFLVPRQAVGSEITVTLVVKNAAGTVILSGSKTQLVKAGSRFSIALSPEGFVRVGGLYVCIHEVTQAEYETYCGYGSLSPSATSGAGPDYPAHYVNWYDAILYCNLRSLSEGLTPYYSIGGSTDPADWSDIVTGTGGKPCGPSAGNSTWNGVSYDSNANGYRLPTVAEWQEAANDGHTYSGSDTVGDVAWYAYNSGTGGGSYTNEGKTHEVKTKDPNAKGIYDMSGNVEEWCEDSGIVSSDRKYCGGGWKDTACEVSSNHLAYPNLRNNNVGFRVVRKAN